MNMATRPCAEVTMTWEMGSVGGEAGAEWRNAVIFNVDHYPAPMPTESESSLEIPMHGKVGKLPAWWFKAWILEWEKPGLGYQLCYFPGWLIKQNGLPLLRLNLLIHRLRRSTWPTSYDCWDGLKKDLCIVDQHNAWSLLNAWEGYLFLLRNGHWEV